MSYALRAGTGLAALSKAQHDDSRLANIRRMREITQNVVSLCEPLFAMTDIEQILEELRVFNRERDWDQFHNGKDLAIGLSIEASELLEAFLWKAPEDVNPDKVREELADVLNFAFQMADKYHLDIKEIMLEKIRRNAAKYPVEKAKGSAKKYNEL